VWCKQITQLVVRYSYSLASPSDMDRYFALQGYVAVQTTDEIYIATILYSLVKCLSNYFYQHQPSCVFYILQDFCNV